MGARGKEGYFNPRQAKEENRTGEGGVRIAGPMIGTWTCTDLLHVPVLMLSYYRNYASVLRVYVPQLSWTKSGVMTMMRG